MGGRKEGRKGGREGGREGGIIRSQLCLIRFSIFLIITDSIARRVVQLTSSSSSSSFASSPPDSLHTALRRTFYRHITMALEDGREGGREGGRAPVERARRVLGKYEEWERGTLGTLMKDIERWEGRRE